MNIEYTEKISKSKWEAMIRKSENGCFFHTPAWAKIIEETCGYRIATRLYEIEGNEVLIPMMESKNGFSYLSMPIPLGYGGIFSSDITSETFCGGIFSLSDITSETLSKILKDVVGGRHLFFDLSLPPLFNLPVQENSAIKEVSSLNSKWKYAQMLSLENGFEYLWRNKFTGQRHRNTRKAEKGGIEILKGCSLEDFRKYYELYAERSKSWGYKKPPHPLKLYENMYKFGLPHVQLKLAIKDDNVVAGCIDFYYGKNVFHWGNAFLEKYKRHRPVDLLVKDSIEEACNKGYKYFNFGCSGNNEGVRRFKESFGAEMIELKNYRVLSRLGKLANLFLMR